MKEQKKDATSRPDIQSIIYDLGLRTRIFSETGQLRLIIGRSVFACSEIDFFQHVNENTPFAELKPNDNGSYIMYTNDDKGYLYLSAYQEGIFINLFQLRNECIQAGVCEDVTDDLVRRVVDYISTPPQPDNIVPFARKTEIAESRINRTQGAFFPNHHTNPNRRASRGPGRHSNY